MRGPCADTVRVRVGGIPLVIRRLDEDAMLSELGSDEVAEEVLYRALMMTSGCEQDEDEEYDYAVEVSTVFMTLEVCIKNWDKVLEKLKAMDDDIQMASLVKALYIECVLINPIIDSTTWSIYGVCDPLPTALEKAVSWLPSRLDPLVSHHVRRMVIEQSPGSVMLDNTVSELSILSVPDSALSLPEKERVRLDLKSVRSLESRLKSNIIGQDHALSHVVSVARRMALGFHDENRPPAVMLFVGPTGVGKTLLAKELAGALFSGGAFGRIDCAQLSESFTVTKLLGPPPGYIGYPSKRDLGDHVDVKTMDPALFYKETRGMETGGVLLFDEIEKADPGVLDVLLTVFDEGYVKTSVGNVIDMRNVIIVITSNLGARNLQHARDSRNKILGFSPSQGNIEKMLSINEINDITMKAVKDWMKPELLSRVTAVIPFVDLDQDALDSIYEIELEKSLAIVRKTIATRITVEDDLKEKLISVCIDRGSGARYISRLVDTYIIDTLAAFYVDEDAPEGGFSPLSLFYESTDGEGFVIVKHYHGEYRHKIARMIES